MSLHQKDRQDCYSEDVSVSEDKSVPEDVSEGVSVSEDKSVPEDASVSSVCPSWIDSGFSLSSS